MRKRLNAEEKRSVIIGIKVKKEIKEKIQYLSEVDDIGMSTYINKILENHIESITKLTPINWEEVLKERRNENG